MRNLDYGLHEGNGLQNTSLCSPNSPSERKTLKMGSACRVLAGDGSRTGPLAQFAELGAAMPDCTIMSKALKFLRQDGEV